MSLLINESYANSSKPLWLSSAGGPVGGSIVMGAGQQIVFPEGGAITMGDIGSPAPGIRITPSLGPAPTFVPLAYIQGDEFRFSKLNTGLYNSRLVTSVAGSNLDSLEIGGTIQGIGPLPVTLADPTAPLAITLPTGTAVRNVGIPIPSYPVTTNGVYDVQFVGRWTIAAPAPTLGDLLNIFIRVNGSYYGTLASVTQLDPTTISGQFQLRARLAMAATLPTTIQSSAVFNGNAATGDVNVTIDYCDVVRVQ